MRWPLAINLALLLALVGQQTALGAEGVSNTTCLGCHTASLDEMSADARASMVEALTVGKTRAAEALLRRNGSLAIDQKAYEASVHGSLPCTACHQDIDKVPHLQKLKRVACSSCHPSVEEVYRESAHAKALAGGQIEAAACQDCHGSHDIRPVKNRASRVYPTNLPKTCASCHSSPDFPRRRAMRYIRPFEAYTKSIHFRALKDRGLLISANCESCHGSHSIKPSTDPTSTIFRTNIPKTCSTCHLGVYRQYKDSIHGKAAFAGILDSPVCTDCHGEHDILAHEEPTSPVFAAVISKTTCPRCHGAERLNRKYGLPAGQVKSYQDSFHGMADRYGETTVANCASCHGVHDIRPSTDLKSAIHPANLQATCGKCHPGAGPNFARGTVHIKLEEKQNIILYYVSVFYIFLIAATIGGMAAHNGLDYAKKIREYHKSTRGKVLYQRFTLNERIQHALLVVSFFVLVISGFGLRFPDAFWVKPIIALKLGFLARSYAHRVAAVVFMLLCLYHLYYIVVTARGREQLASMFPRKKDLHDVRHQLRYFFGYEEHRAKLPRFSYVEKSEYLALVWGSIIMILTGIILWFEVGALEWMPKWCWDLAEIIHYYEAWLATLAIIVWHLYHVMLNPEAHGVSLAMLTGDLTEEDMEHEHGLELEQIKQKQKRQE
jgi:cytochrome b subunit of formate dehydrogenase/DnaJ-class molecular chaperone